jgi:hypothetical protein
VIIIGVHYLALSNTASEWVLKDAIFERVLLVPWVVCRATYLPNPPEE